MARVDAKDARLRRFVPTVSRPFPWIKTIKITTALCLLVRHSVDSCRESYFTFCVHRLIFFLFRFHFTDRANEFSDEDEEIEFSSGEYDPNNVAGNGGYMRKYRKIDQTENDGEAEDGALGSDSEFENLKEKGSRAKISQVNKLLMRDKLSSRK